MDPYYYMLAFMFVFIFTVLFFLTRSANRIAKEREEEAAAAAASGNDAATPMGTTRQRRARREDNYFPFSTAPNAHVSGAPVPQSMSHGHHPGNGMSDGMLGQLSGGPTGGSFMAGSMMGYGVSASQPQSQQQQAQQALLSRINPTSSLTSMSNSIGSLTGGGGAAQGGPAVPAPRSTAALIAEATGAPPPPPPPSRAVLLGTPGASASLAAGGGGAGGPSVVMGGVQAGVAGGVGAHSFNMATPPAPAPGAGLGAPMSVAASPGVAAASPGAEGSDGLFTTSVEGSSFRAFTAAAAAALSTAHVVDGEEGAADGADGYRRLRPAAAGMAPYTQMEVQLTLPLREQAAAPAGGAAWDLAREETEADEVEDDFSTVTRLLASIVAEGDDDDGRYAADVAADMDAGRDVRAQVFYGRSPQEVVACICSRVKATNLDTPKLRATLRSLTLAFVESNQYRFLSVLPPQLAAALRYSIVQYLLVRLAGCGHAVEHCDPFVKGLLAMVFRGYVSPAGFAAVVDTFLQHSKHVAVALRLLSLALICCGPKHAVKAALEGVPRIAQRLRDLYASDPTHEMEVALVTRRWQQERPILSGSLELENSGPHDIGQTTCMSYFGVRDELITGHMNGSVVLWGAPAAVRVKPRALPPGKPRPVIRARGVVPLPLDCVPVGMAGQRIDGQYLAIASMPYKSRKPYSEYCAAANTASGGMSVVDPAGWDGGANTPAAPRREAAANGAGVGAIIIITCNDNSIRWTKGEVILRPPGVALTAITAFRNTIVAVGESMVRPAAASATDSAASVTSPHRLSFVDVTTGSVMRQIPKAHEDYITTLNVLDASGYVLLSGGRDGAVKLWDPRSRDDSPVVNTALSGNPAARTSTVSSLCANGHSIVSSALDGSMLVWDLRAMAAPRVRHDFTWPIVDVAMVSGGRAVAAAAHGLVTVDLETLQPLDALCSRSGYSHVMANNTGAMIFTAECSGPLSVMAVAES